MIFFFFVQLENHDYGPMFTGFPFSGSITSSDNYETICSQIITTSYQLPLVDETYNMLIQDNIRFISQLVFLSKNSICFSVKMYTFTLGTLFVSV